MTKAGFVRAGVARVERRGLEHAVASSLVDLSLEELSNIRVTSVSRRAEPLATAAASVFVITGEDIRRAGAITIMEALRLAPNLQVARNAAEHMARRTALVGRRQQARTGQLPRRLGGRARRTYVAGGPRPRRRRSAADTRRGESARALAA